MAIYGPAASRRGAIRSTAIGVAAALLCVCVSWAAAPETVRVITSPEHEQETLDRAFVQGAFTMRIRRWPDGAPVRVFVLPDNDPVHVLFSRDELGTFPYVLRSVWDRLVYTGTGLAPTVVQSEQEMRDRVQSTPGAIGYVRASPRGGTARDSSSASTGEAP